MSLHSKGVKSSPHDQNPRYIAAGDLMHWLQSSRIDYHLRGHFKIASDFGLYKHIVSSVVRFRRRLEVSIELLTKRSLNKIDSEALVCLFIGLVQLDKDSRVESYAAINESVELIKKLGKPYLKGFVNANLRRYLREREAIEYSIDSRPLDIATSHEKEQVTRWINQFGAEKAKSICQANNRLPVLHIVLNPSFDGDEIVRELKLAGFELSDCHREGFSVRNPEGFFKTKWANDGCFLVQDRSFQLINCFLDEIPKKNVLDACAAPGGKTIHFEWKFETQSELLVATDVDRQRLELLKENLVMFRSKAQVIHADLLKPPFKQQFDLVICDAPCSGTGTIRKHPEIKWLRSKNDYVKNQKIQIGLLKSLAETVKPGGHLLYVTCSLEAEENQKVVDAFLNYAKKDFSLVPLSYSCLKEDFITEEGYYQAVTSESRMGAFSALFKRKSPR